MPARGGAGPLAGALSGVGRATVGVVWGRAGVRLGGAGAGIEQGPGGGRWGGLPPDFLSGLFFRNKNQGNFAGQFDLRKTGGVTGFLSPITSPFSTIPSLWARLAKKSQPKGL